MSGFTISHIGGITAPIARAQYLIFNAQRRRWSAFARGAVLMPGVTMTMHLIVLCNAQLSGLSALKII